MYIYIYIYIEFIYIYIYIYIFVFMYYKAPSRPLRAQVHDLRLALIAEAGNAATPGGAGAKKEESSDKNPHSRDP